MKHLGILICTLALMWSGCRNSTSISHNKKNPKDSTPSNTSYNAPSTLNRVSERMALLPGAGNAVIQNNLIRIETANRYAGAVTQIFFRGKQYVNDHDTGRLFQTALTFDYRGECYNPTEAGSSSNLPSDLTQISVSEEVLSTSVTPAYWLNPHEGNQYCGTPVGDSPYALETISKEIQLNYNGDPQVVRWKTHIDVARPHQAMNVEALTGYHTSDFTSYFTYDPIQHALVPWTAPQLVVRSGTPEIINARYSFSPLVLSTPDGAHALGAWGVDQDNSSPDHLTRIANYSGFTYQGANAYDSTNKWSISFSYTNTIPNGRYSYDIFLFFGNRDEVLSRMNQFSSSHPNQLLSLLAGKNGAKGFDLAYYRSFYGDIGQAIPADRESNLQHYLLFGLSEGRSGSVDFNAKAYFSRYADLRNAFGDSNYIAALKHYLSSGISEGRNGSLNDTPTTAPDTTTPVITAFTITPVANSLSVSVTNLTATDNVGVTGVKITETSTAPLASATGWSASPPTSYTFTSTGSKTLHAWAKDAAGNVSLARSQSVTISGSTIPVYSYFNGIDHFLTLDKNEGDHAAGYKYQGIAFRVYQNYASGMRALYRCYVPSTGDHFVSVLSTCEGQNAEGIYGYVYTSSLAGHSAVYRFYSQNLADHLISTTSTQTGYALEGILGYTLP